MELRQQTSFGNLFTIEAGAFGGVAGAQAMNTRRVRRMGRDPIARPGLRALALISQISMPMLARDRRGGILLIRDDLAGEFEPGNAQWRVTAWYRRR